MPTATTAATAMEAGGAVNNINATTTSKGDDDETSIVMNYLRRHLSHTLTRRVKDAASKKHTIINASLSDKNSRIKQKKTILSAQRASIMLSIDNIVPTALTSRNNEPPVPKCASKLEFKISVPVERPVVPPSLISAIDNVHKLLIMMH
jgi:hypothetical protein